MPGDMKPVAGASKAGVMCSAGPAPAPRAPEAEAWDDDPETPASPLYACFGRFKAACVVSPPRSRATRRPVEEARAAGDGACARNPKGW